MRGWWTLVCLVSLVLPRRIISEAGGGAPLLALDPRPSSHAHCAQVVVAEPLRCWPWTDQIDRVQLFRRSMFSVEVCWHTTDREAVALQCQEPGVLLWLPPPPLNPPAACNATILPRWSVTFLSCTDVHLQVWRSAGAPEYWLVHGPTHTQLLPPSFELVFDWASREEWALVPARQPRCPVIHIPPHRPTACVPTARVALRWQDLDRDPWWVMAAWGLSLAAFNVGLFAGFWIKFPHTGMAWQSMFMVTNTLIQRHLSRTAYFLVSVISLVGAGLLVGCADRRFFFTKNTLQGLLFVGLFCLMLLTDWGVPPPVHRVQCA